MVHSQEIQRGDRFQFGANWQEFLKVITETHIVEAQHSLCKMLEVTDLNGISFLDVGCGSGLFSLAARRLGASVMSFDYDPQSVECTRILKERYFSTDPDWRIEQGSVLDVSYIEQLGEFKVVYSWGVLHHTGRMWQALENITPLVKAGGKLFIALYNDQGRASRIWKRYKQLYNHAPKSLQVVMASIVAARFWAITSVRDMLKGRPFITWRTYYKKGRGMSAWHDVVDWAGGYPFEVAKPEQVFDFYKTRGFALTKLTTKAGAIGCNEFVFIRNAEEDRS